MQLEWVNISLGVLCVVMGIIAFLIIAKYKRTERKSRNEDEERIFQLVESSKDIVYYYEIKPKCRFLYISPAIKKFLGQEILEEAFHNSNSPFERIHPDDFELFSKKVAGELDYSKPIIQRWRNDSGDYRWFEEYATPIYERGGLKAIQGIIRNIDEKIKLQQDLEYRVIYDALTQVYNREFFEQCMNTYDSQVDVSTAIILCDLDELKFLNDHYGHEKGDIFLKESAKLLNQYSSEDVVVSRIGGDEFAIILINTNKEEVSGLHENLCSDIKRYNLKSKDLKINMSMGYALSEHSLGNMKSLFAEADKNMYREKNLKKKQNKFKVR
ncbi:GGDEF domain-containing protein [Virgibacillus sp. FSP13]